MKKTISMLLCIVLILGLAAVSVSGESISDVSACIDSYGQVTVSGTVGSGAGKLVSIKILDPEGDMEYYDSCASEAGGYFLFTYTLTNPSKGKYTVKINAEGISSPAGTSFDYRGGSAGATLTASAFMDSTTKQVTVSGTISSGAGRIISVKITGPDNTTEYSGFTISMSGGRFLLNYTLTNSAAGKYTVSVGALDVAVPVTCYFGNGAYINVQAGIDVNKQVTVSGVAGIPGTIVSVSIADPKGNIEYVDSASVKPDGKFRFSYTMTNTLNGRYNVSVGTRELKTPFTTYFIYGGALLSSLSVGDASLSPAFSPETLSYSSTVGNAVSYVKVTPTAMDTGASITVNGIAVASGSASGSIPLNIGINTVSTVVTAKDGTTMTYTVLITRSAPVITTTTETVDLSTDNNLSSLTISSGTLSPSFVSATRNYALSVDYSTDSITVTPTVAESHATVTVNGTAVNSGSVSGAISLSVGNNTIPVVVTAQDGTTKTYTITVTRAAAPLSGDANLSGLTISSGTLSPSFVPATTSYALSVDYSTDSITVMPAVAESHATVTVNGTAVNSGSTSGAISLSVGNNTIPVVVTAQDGTAKTYAITVTRAADASLSCLTVQWMASGDILGETSLISFDSATADYEVTQDTPNVTGIHISATAADLPATVTISAVTQSYDNPASIILPTFDFIITILVTGRDGVTTETYTITVHVFTGW